MKTSSSFTLSEDLERKISGLWSSAEDRDKVREALRAYAQWAHGSERVPFAILKLCRGDVARVLSMVGEARLDYRDILMAAEYPDQGDALLASMRPGATEADRAHFEEMKTRDRQQYEDWLKK
jgi:hypothetical protein